jgi:butyrate kinase
MEILNESNFNLKDLNAVCGRGGMLKPIKSGTYLINQAIIDDLKQAKYGEHASNLGSIIAFEIASKLNIPAYTVDPVSIDEMEPIARISGMPLIIRQSFFHALNHKAVAKKVSKQFNKKYEEMNLIIAHLGGGISIAAHHHGRVIDVNESLEGDGPMTPERSGDVPLGQLYKMCFSGKYTINEIRRMNHGQGGLAAYLGTNNADEIVRRINNGDEYAKLIYDAMIYQIAKEIGAYATVLCGEIDFIVLTGGLAYDDYLVSNLIKRISFIAEVLRYPGENEMLSLVNGALQVLKNHEKALIY